MARELIDRFRGLVRAREVQGHLPDGAAERDRAQAKGKEVHVEPQTEQGARADLLEALRASVEAHSRKGAARATASSPR